MSPSTIPVTVPAVIEPVTVCEVWPRDGIQGWPTTFDTQVKAAVIRSVISAGVREIDATSFVAPHATSQFGDAEQLLTSIREDVAGVTVRVLTVNTRSFDRIEALPDFGGVVDVCGFPISASESHNLANLRKDHAAQKEQLAQMIDRSGSLGLQPLMCVATAFGCPIEGVVTAEAVLELSRWGVDRGVRRVMLGDTTGMADPAQAFDLFTRVAAELGDEVGLYGHFHDTRGSGIANTLAAIAAGVRIVDSSLGGVGGEPPSVEQNHSGEAGNVCSEDLVALLDRMGIETGIDVNRLLEVGRVVEEASGRALRSQVQRSGLAVPAR